MISGTPSQLWLGVFVCVWLAAAAQADCIPPSSLQPATLESVVDGDTLRLTDGRLVRLIGVNTPEIGRDGAPHQPYAVAAARAVRQWLGKTVWLAPGHEPTDRYGRTLAAVYRDRDKKHLGEYLLQQGLGWQVSVPPNLRDVACLRAAELAARRSERGVWRMPEILRAKSLTPADAGFKRVTGRVTRVSPSRRALWIELDSALSLRLDKRDQVHFRGVDMQSLVGQELTVRGWLIYRDRHRAQYPAHMMVLRHPAMLETDEE
ncbi:thermonuclease family protein [Litorivivens sp.]|uniref:thermonuclease family protein n=2 Tax=Litorivivens sp. TaxID=2020868 RepID=UPI00356381AB